MTTVNQHKMKTRPLPLPDSMIERISAASKDTGLSENDIIRASIRVGIGEVESFFAKYNVKRDVSLAAP